MQERWSSITKGLRLRAGYARMSCTLNESMCRFVYVCKDNNMGLLAPTLGCGGFFPVEVPTPNIVSELRETIRLHHSQREKCFSRSYGFSSVLDYGILGFHEDRGRYYVRTTLDSTAESPALFEDERRRHDFDVKRKCDTFAWLARIVCWSRITTLALIVDSGCSQASSGCH